MKIADMHGDTMYLMLDKRREGSGCELAKNNLHLDIEKMKAADYLVQNFALFVNWGSHDDPYEEAMAEYKIFLEEMEKNKEHISQVFSYEDIVKNQQEGKLSALLTLEEGEVCLGQIEKLEEFYSYGARMMTLTWNYDNSLSTANANKIPWKRNYTGNRTGLTETGIEFVERMEELGMIPDVSHMSDEGIEDMLTLAKKPFVASHYNARSLCNHPRNLTDDFLKRMGEKGCVIGTNFASMFLQEGAGYTKNEWIADHIFYMVDKAGVESVGFGTDFDGIECGLEIENCSNMQMLAELLKKRGMSEDQIEHIFYKNVMRLYKELL
jgi:membrane dipeptidase